MIIIGLAIGVVTVGADDLDNVLAQAQSFFVKDYLDSYVPEKDRCNDIAKNAGLEINEFTAVALNRTAFKLYEKKEFEMAAVLFQNATILDPGYVYGHFNLACTLALMNENGASVDIKQILYHLHKSVELDERRLEKAQTDPDLNSIHGLAQFKNFLQVYERRTRFIVENDSVFLDIAGTRHFLTRLAHTDEYPVGLLPTYAISPNQEYIAFFAEDESGINVYVLSETGIVKQATTIGNIGSDSSNFYTGIAWSPSSDGIAFIMVGVLWYFNIFNDELVSLTDEKFISVIAQPSFVDDDTVGYLRGEMIVYEFHGEEWQVDIDGSNSEFVSPNVIIEAAGLDDVEEGGESVFSF